MDKGSQINRLLGFIVFLLLILVGWLLWSRTGPLADHMDGKWVVLPDVVIDNEHPNDHPHFEMNSKYELYECDRGLCHYRMMNAQSMKPDAWSSMRLYDVPLPVVRLLKNNPNFGDGDICDDHCVMGGFVDSDRIVHFVVIDKRLVFNSACRNAGKQMCANVHLAEPFRTIDGRDVSIVLDGLTPGAGLTLDHIWEIFAEDSPLKINHAGSAHSGGDEH